MAPQNGEPARLGIHVTNLAGVASSTNTESAAYLRTGQGVKSDFGIDSFLKDLPRTVGIGPLNQDITITHMTLTFFGIVGGKAFMTTPAACIPAPISAEGTSWGGTNTSRSSAGYTPTGCTNVPFTPDLEITPATTRTETPSAFQLAINFPTEELPLSQSTGHAADIRLPPGVTISPGVANGLQFCSDADFGIDNGNAPNCPAGSVLGDTTFFAASLGRLDGQVFEGDPKPGQQIRLLTVVQQGATRIKFLDIVTPDPNTGQILNEYHDVGQLPFTRFEYRFRGGDNPALITPTECGQHLGTSLGTPWLGAPDFRLNITGTAGFSTSYDGNGAPCPAQLPFTPGRLGQPVDDAGGREPHRDDHAHAARPPAADQEHDGPHARRPARQADRDDPVRHGPGEGRHLPELDADRYRAGARRRRQLARRVRGQGLPDRPAQPR